MHTHFHPIARTSATHRRCIGSTVLVCGVVATCLAGSSSARQERRADISVVVTASDGRPVEGLRREELTITLDGRTLPVVSLEHVTGPYDVVVVYDDMHLGATRTTRANEVVTALLHEAPPDWRIGLQNTSGRPVRLVPPTENRELLVKSLRGLLGQYMGAGGPWTAAAVVEQLERLAREVRQDPDARPTAVLLISEWFAVPLTLSGFTDEPDAGRGWWRAQAELNTGGIPLYAVSPQGITVPFAGGSASDLSFSLEMMAQTTGGTVLPSTNDRTAAVRRMLQDLAARYRVTVDVSAQALGQNEHLEVRTSRPGAVVRSARGYVPPR